VVGGSDVTKILARKIFGNEDRNSGQRIITRITPPITHFKGHIFRLNVDKSRIPDILFQVFSVPVYPDFGDEFCEVGFELGLGFIGDGLN
jgi:hypothetical protein